MKFDSGGVIISILSNVEIREYIDAGKLKITPSSDFIQAGSIDLHLGNTFRVFSNKNNEIILKDDFDANEYTDIINLKNGEYLKLKPGEFVTGITYEFIELPSELAGWIEGRSRFARIGLTVHATSGFIHPGSKGHQVLEINNLSPHILLLTPRLRICQIVFEKVTKIGEPYRGKYHEQISP
jgi:dCTP deaminase